MSQREPKTRFEWMTSQEAAERGIPFARLMSFSHGGHGDSHIFALDWRYAKRLKRRAKASRKGTGWHRAQLPLLQVLKYAAPAA